MAKSALAARLDKLEALLASRLHGPLVCHLLQWQEDPDEAIARRKDAGEIPQNARVMIIAGWRSRRKPEPLAQPLALPKPPLRLTFQEEPHEEPNPPAPCPKAPDTDDELEKAEQARERFHWPIRYPRTGLV